ERRHWLTSLDAYDAAHEPAPQRLGNKAAAVGTREMIERIEFPVVGDIKAGWPFVYSRVQRIGTQQTARNNAVLYIGLALCFVGNLAMRERALEFDSMARPLLQHDLHSVVARACECGDVDVAAVVRIDIVVGGRRDIPE